MKKGFFKITDDMYKNGWEYVSMIFKDFRPTHLEFRHWENDMWYLYGVSDKFSELKEGDAVPQYDAIFTKQEDGATIYEIKKYQ